MVRIFNHSLPLFHFPHCKSQYLPLPLAAATCARRRATYRRRATCPAAQDAAAAAQDEKLREIRGNLVEPHGKCTVAFSLAWSSPKVKFSKGSTFHRRYTKFYGTSERAAKDLAHDALTQYKRWEEDIEKWQNPILQDESLPEWCKFTLFNELYFLVAGGTIWIDSPLPSSNMRNKSQDQVKELENTEVKVTEAKVSRRQGADAGRTTDSTYDVE
ncbi:uncharacterized protein, partial [Arachis hypogaea]|uniref:uncharacterized protein n=1 Tax=Arachis hypogaea TaxID=3818 RepID=UPI003B21550B